MTLTKAALTSGATPLDDNFSKIFNDLSYTRIPGGVLYYLKNDCDHIFNVVTEIVNNPSGPNFKKQVCSLCNGEKWINA